MHEERSKSLLTENKVSSTEDKILLRKKILMIVSRKSFFISTLVVCMVFAALYIKYTTPVYRVYASILIEEQKEKSSSGNDQLLEGFGLMPGMKNLDNQIMVLSSRSLISKTLDEMAYDIIFYQRRLFSRLSLYPLRPLKIISENGTQPPKDIEFAFKYLGNNNFRLDASSEKMFEIHSTAAFGERIEFNSGSFRIEQNNPEWFNERKSKKLCFILPGHRNLVESYLKRLKIEPASRKGSIVRISLEGTNRSEDLAFLKKFTEIFLNLSLEKKNIEAIRIIQFIDNQLAGISDSLLLTENRLQKFRSENKVMNISAQGQVLIDQSVNLENEKARLGIESSYYNYLSEYLEKDVSADVPVSPATMGIVDPGLTKVVAELNDLQGRLYNKSMGEKNPMQNQLIQKISNTKETLKEILKGLIRANNMAIKENQEQINTINQQASALPKTEKELLGIERKYKLNDQLYTFLLEKRSVAQMQKASNVADNEIIDYPEYENKPVRPRKPVVFLLALVTGLGFPFLWIFLADIFNIRIKDIDEIMTITDIPVTGILPHSTYSKNTLVLDEPRSYAAEAFRTLRARLNFFTKEIKTPVILVTSVMPDEGKTFISTNLASVFALAGKKTVLIGFDLRQSTLHSDFELDNERGISTWLIGKDILEDIIQSSGHENLHIITSGPVPPNPAELTALGKTEELIKSLKKRYDCIIIDTSPIGTVSDTYNLTPLADTSIIVVKQNFTIKELLSGTLNDLKSNNIKSPCIVINDVMSVDGQYGYGGIYKYNYNADKVKKHQLKARYLPNLFATISDKIKFRK
jgi:tyrosine-protein kinase Etk/Wzc